MYKKALLYFAAFILSLSVKAQQVRPLSVSIFSNATAMPTSSKEIFKSLHPGITIGTAFRYNNNEKHQWAQTLKLGYFYHQYVQSSVQLYSELEYRYILNNGLNIAGDLGVGYVHSFPATQIFEQNDAGLYERKANLGRPQLMGTLAAGVGYMVNKQRGKPIEIFTRYQFWVQTPFVRQYVPVLPGTALHVGINYPLYF